MDFFCKSGGYQGGGMMNAIADGSEVGAMQVGAPPVHLSLRLGFVLVGEHCCNPQRP